jgi:hypothetical protein
VIRPELRFEAVGGVAERCGHHSGISDDHVQGFPFASKWSAQARTLFKLARSSSTSSKLPPLAPCEHGCYCSSITSRPSRSSAPR